MCKHRILFPSIQRLAWLPQGVPRGNQNVVKITIFGLTHWLKHRLTRKLLKIDRYIQRGVWQALNWFFHPCNILRDSRRGVSRGNKNVGCGTWKRRFFSRSWIMSKRINMLEFFSPSGSHTILVYRSYTDTKHRAASLRQQSFLFIVIGAGVWVYSPTSSQPSKFGIFATNLPIKCDSLVPFTRNSQHTHTENLSVMVAIGRRMHNQERPIEKSDLSSLFSIVAFLCILEWPSVIGSE